MILPPEVIAEQVMGYAIGASELIPTLQPAAKNTYNIAILPQGPHFYTGLLQAAGYLLLNGQKKKLLIISQQSDDPKTVLVDTTIYGPMFGQTRATPMPILSKIKTQIGAKLSTKDHQTVGDSLQFQMPFFRTITDTQELIHIGIGEKTPQIQIKKLLSWIHKNVDQYNVVCIANIELPPIKKPTKTTTDEYKFIRTHIQKSSSTTSLVTIFQQLVTTQKKKIEIIAYVNPGDFGKTKSLSTRYICAVG